MTDESFLASWAGLTMVHLVWSSLDISCSLLFIILYIIAGYFAIETEFISITVLAFFSFHFVEDI
jgi:hypothetical protein